MPLLCRMTQRDARLAGLGRGEAACDGAPSTIPAAVEAWVREVPLPVVLQSLNGDPPGSVHRGVVARVTAAA